MELFVKIIDGWEPLVIFDKSTSVDVWQGSEYVSRVKWFACTFCPGLFLKNFNSVSVTIKCLSDIKIILNFLTIIRGHSHIEYSHSLRQIDADGWIV